MEFIAVGVRAATGHGVPGGTLPQHPSEPAASGSLCMRCEVRARCLGGIAAEAGTAQLQGILSGRKVLRQGEELYGLGDRFEHVYAVRSGALKSTAGRDAGEQVVGFHFPGELVGVDGMAGGRQRVTATALEDTQLCALRFAPRGGEPEGVRAFLARLWDMMSCEVVRERTHRSLLAMLPPAHRVAAFLASVAGRRRGAVAGRARLLPAEDIASYLGVPADTVDSVRARH